MVERPSWAQVIAFTALAGVTCSAGTVLGASAAAAARRPPAGLAAAPTVPAATPAPAAASGWGVQPMGGSPNPTGVARRTVQPTVYVPPVPGDAVQASRGAQPTQPGGAAPGGPVGAPVGLPAGAPVGAPVAPPTPAATPTPTGQARVVQLPPALPTITSRATAFPRTAPPTATAPRATAPTVPRLPVTPPLPTPP